MKYSHIFVESLPGGYPISIFTQSELKFLESKNLIKIRGDRFFPTFVGELITTENSYFSLPKNFEAEPTNIDLFKQILSNYKDVKGLDGKSLLTNNSFTVLKDGVIKSEKFYYNELKEFFMDYITYEFIYPKKYIKKHSTSPISGGKVDVLSTIKNRDRRGPGITYRIKDIKNSKDWNLDDIYFSILKNLQKKWGTFDDEKQISEMTDLLKNEGYELNIIDVSNPSEVIQNVEKCEVNIIHNPIKNLILDYLHSRNVGESFQINAFYTLKFQYVWEDLVRKSLRHDEEFQNSYSELFKEFPTKSIFISNEDGDKVEVSRKIYPDLFSNHNGKKFIGDAKYYQEPENSDFGKEMYLYNQSFNNQYPMCVFIPSSVTRRLEVRRHGIFELILFKVSVKDIIQDSIDGSFRVLSKIQILINKNTFRKNSKSGFKNN